MNFELKVWGLKSSLFLTRIFIFMIDCIPNQYIVRIESNIWNEYQGTLDFALVCSENGGQKSGIGKKLPLKKR